MNPARFSSNQVRAAGMVAGLFLLFGAGCSVTPDPDPLPAGQYSIAQVPVDSDPMGAMISYNGRPVGTAPVTLRVEVNEFGDMIDDLRLQADFSTSFSQTPISTVVEEEFTRGDKPPSMVRFRTEGADSRSR